MSPAEYKQERQRLSLTQAEAILGVSKSAENQPQTRDADKLLRLAQTLAAYVEPEIWADSFAQDAIDELDNYLHSGTKL